MTKTVDLQRSNPFPMIVSYTGTPFTKAQNPRRWCHVLSTRFLNDHCPQASLRIWWWLEGSLESSWKVQDDGFFVCFTCARCDQEIRTIPINAHPNSEGVIVVTWLGGICWYWGLEFKWAGLAFAIYARVIKDKKLFLRPQYGLHHKVCNFQW